MVLDGKPLTENVAILTALSKLYPEAGLLATQDLMAEVQALSMLARCASGLHPYVTRLCMPQFICDVESAAPRIQEIGADMLIKSLTILEAQLQGRNWFLRDWPAVDAYVFWVLKRIQGASIGTNGFTNLVSYSQRMLARPSVYRALAIEKFAI